MARYKLLAFRQGYLTGESPWFDVMNDRYDTLLAEGRRKITRQIGEQVYLVVIYVDAYFSATVGVTKQQAESVYSSLYTSALGRLDSTSRLWFKTRLYIQ